VYPLPKTTLRKVYPEKKAEIDAYFKAGHSLPDTVEEAKSLLARWAE
jgi:hypothetical protein